MGCVSSKEHALWSTATVPSKEWTQNKAQREKVVRREFAIARGINCAGNARTARRSLQCVGRPDDKNQEGHQETLVVIRFRNRDNQQVLQTDYYLSMQAQIPMSPNLHASPKPSNALRNASGEPRAKRAWRLRVRQLEGWHHHQILSLIATWFLVSRRRGRKNGRRQSRCNKSAKA